jgi:hypothetical protein
MNIPLTSFTLADGTPLGKFPDSSPGLTIGGAIRWDNDSDPPRIVCMVSALGNVDRQGSAPIKLRLGVLKIGVHDSPTFDVSLAPMVSGQSRPGKRVDLTSGAVRGNDFQMVEAGEHLRLEAGTISYALCVKPTPGTLHNDEVEIVAVEWLV